MASAPQVAIPPAEDDADALDAAIAFLQTSGRTREAAAVGRLRDEAVNGGRLPPTPPPPEVSIERAARYLGEPVDRIPDLIEIGLLKRGTDPSGETVTEASVKHLRTTWERMAKLHESFEKSPILGREIEEQGRHLVDQMIADARARRGES
jgi:hypothetical protein